MSNDKTESSAGPVAFLDLNADSEDQEASQIESICMRCYEQVNNAVYLMNTI